MPAELALSSSASLLPCNDGNSIILFWKLYLCTSVTCCRRVMLEFHHVSIEIPSCVDGNFTFAPALLHCIITRMRLNKVSMMWTGNDVLMYFNRFASFHRNGALKSRGLQTYACTEGESKRLHIFTSASSLSKAPLS